MRCNLTDCDSNANGVCIDGFARSSKDSGCQSYNPVDKDGEDE